MSRHVIAKSIPDGSALEARRGGRPVPGEHEWRHGEEPSHRAHHYRRPADEREIVRHKSFALVAETPDEAAFEMDVLDYDFHLFIDVDTRLDSVLYRAGPTGYRLARTAPGWAHRACRVTLVSANVGDRGTAGRNR
jgi:hypothetical protein